MNDPHVVALIYGVEHSESINFDEAEPLEFETSQFIARVENGTARIASKANFSSEKEARAAVEPFIHMWEMWDAINPLLSGFRLVYSTAEVIDRNPQPGNYANLVLPAIQMSAHGVVINALRCYPEPPPEQAAMDADIEVMAYRHWLYRQGRDTLGAMAYFCLTVLEDSTGCRRGKREHAAKRNNIDLAGLENFGEKIAVLRQTIEDGIGPIQDTLAQHQKLLEDLQRGAEKRAQEATISFNKAIDHQDQILADFARKLDDRADDLLSPLGRGTQRRVEELARFSETLVSTVDAIRAHNRELEAELERSRGITLNVQNSLADMVELVVERLGTDGATET